MNNNLSLINFYNLIFSNCHSLNSYRLLDRIVGGGSYACNCFQFFSNCILIYNCSCDGDGSGFYSKVNSSCNHFYNNTIISKIPKIGRCVGHIDSGNIIVIFINSTFSICKDYSGIIFGNRYENSLITKYINSNNNFENCPFFGYSKNSIGKIYYLNILNNYIINSSRSHSFYLDSYFEVNFLNSFNNDFYGYCVKFSIFNNCNTDMDQLVLQNHSNFNSNFNISIQTYNFVFIKYCFNNHSFTLFKKTKLILCKFIFFIL